MAALTQSPRLKITPAFNIIVASLAHDFYPYTWGIFVPALVDSTITVASFAWFFPAGFLRNFSSRSHGALTWAR